MPTLNLLAGPSVDGEELVEAWFGIIRVPRDDLPASGRDVEELQRTGEEPGDGCLVGCIQGRPGRPTAAGDLEAQFDRAERVMIRLFEGQCLEAEPVEPLRGAGEAL